MRGGGGGGGGRGVGRRGGGDGSLGGDGSSPPGPAGGAVDLEIPLGPPHQGIPLRNEQETIKMNPCLNPCIIAS